MFPLVTVSINSCPPSCSSSSSCSLFYREPVCDSSSAGVCSCGGRPGSVYPPHLLHSLHLLLLLQEEVQEVRESQERPARAGMNGGLVGGTYEAGGGDLEKKVVGGGGIECGTG